jgi:hypothetical protein
MQLNGCYNIQRRFEMNRLFGTNIIAITIALILSSTCAFAVE